MAGVALPHRRTASTKAAVSPAESAEKRMVDDLARTVQIINANQPHYCFGTLDLGPVELYLKSRLTADGEGKGSAAWFKFPPNPDAMETLVKACEPANFGLGSKYMYDPTYRLALKLDPDQFAINNDPRPALVEKIAAILASESRGVVAELYKLNVHVDSPRSDTMFGSLVVCLPSAHKGGQLVLKHQGREKVFDWGGNEAADRGLLQWAAYYSDVEHEILPIETGHRVTLTYNLYWPDRPTDNKTTVAAEHAAALPRLDISTPFLESLSAKLAKPEFLPEGGYLGFSLSHNYPLTDAGWRAGMRLKGADNAILEAATTLGLQTELNAVYFVPANEYHMYRWYESLSAGMEVDEEYGEDWDGSGEERSLRSYGSSFYDQFPSQTVLLVSKDFKGSASDLEDDTDASTDCNAIIQVF
ncbi:hypothetical protein HK101_006612 [Irineochytrium annulatum]|nr:hypothetical protein HK101_006612 [Irineochytrium annulatum]